MSLTRKKTAELNTSSTVKAAKQAQKASSAAAANAASAAQNAALTAQNAAGLAQVAAQNAAVVATTAAHNASDVAQTAAAGLSKGVRQRVYTARSWAAPRIDNAADYCSTTVAPKVSAALRTAARQVSPAETPSSKRSSVLTWSVLGATILAALGAGAALARRRYRAAIAADSEATDEEVLADSSDSQAAADSPDGTPSAAAKPKDQGTETSVNGRVTATGR
jgi:trimeric autotransporter adhesin